MAKNLVIVESPAKAKTIENYLGKDFVVKSSFGHVRDLASKGISVDVDNGFVPKYEVSSDKKSLVTELKKLAKTAEVVWLATDEDREGEAISWHLMEALKLDEKKTKRITFNEITKPAILKAIESPRSIDIDLVNAQQARRVLDRLVGFELSPVLWRKVKPSLSAGRVQSVAVRLIVEKEKDIKAFVPESYFGVKGLLQKTSGESFEVATSHQFKSEDEVTDYLKSVDEKELKVTDIEVKPGSRNPSAPFTTSTLQQEAGTKLGYSVSRTMSVAQKLYESGKITYMRTDSVNLSDQAINQAKNVVTELFGADHSNP